MQLSDKEQLDQLQGEFNGLMSAKRWLKSEGKMLLARIDELETKMQRENELDAEQQARMNAATGCITGECE